MDYPYIKKTPGSDRVTDSAEIQTAIEKIRQVRLRQIRQIIHKSLGLGYASNLSHISDTNVLTSGKIEFSLLDLDDTPAVRALAKCTRCNTPHIYKFFATTDSSTAFVQLGRLLEKAERCCL